MKLAILVAALLVFGVLVAPALSGSCDGSTNVVKQTNVVNGKVCTSGSCTNIASCGSGTYNPCDWYNYFPRIWR